MGTDISAAGASDGCTEAARAVCHSGQGTPYAFGPVLESGRRRLETPRGGLWATDPESDVHRACFERTSLEKTSITVIGTVESVDGRWSSQVAPSRGMWTSRGCTRGQFDGPCGHLEKARSCPTVLHSDYTLYTHLSTDVNSFGRGVSSHPRTPASRRVSIPATIVPARRVCDGNGIRQCDAGRIHAVGAAQCVERYRARMSRCVSSWSAA